MRAGKCEVCRKYFDLVTLTQNGYNVYGSSGIITFGYRYENGSKRELETSKTVTAELCPDCYAKVAKEAGVLDVLRQRLPELFLKTVTDKEDEINE